MVLLLALLGLTPSWEWPLPPPVAVTRPFQPPATAFGPGHRGVDLGSVVGTPVRAAGAGVVTVAGQLAGRGVVVVLHGALRTTYEPVRAEVHVGQSVEAGERLGTLAPGHAGCPRPACLHWGLRRGRDYLDPFSLVGRGRVRLLPLEATSVRVRRPAVLMPAQVGAAQSGAGESVAVPGSPSGPRQSGGTGGPARPGETAAVLAEAAAAIGAGSVLLRRRRPIGAAP
jgi:murein DD-endopeptidase MepM/ murein hydrolase activator NlpD